LKVFSVRSVRRATPSSRIVRISTPDNSFEYRAGQWARIGPEDSGTHVPYSIASSPDETSQDRTIEFLIKTDARGRWGENFPPLVRGLRLAVRGPFGRFIFPDHATERHWLFIAGGTGIAPLRSMLRHARVIRPDASCRLLYSARTPDDFAYLRELRGMARRKELQLRLTVTRGWSHGWRGGRGRIARSELSALIDTPEILCFVCGPAAMVADVPEMLGDLGIDRSRIRGEEWNEEL
jgi:ferredoxin-NADP reductase